MRRERLYVLCKEDLLRIGGLCESLGLAIGSILQKRGLEPEKINTYPSVRRYRQKVRESLRKEVDAETLEKLF